MSAMPDVKKLRMEMLRKELAEICGDRLRNPDAPLSDEAGALLMLVGELRQLRVEMQTPQQVLA